ncbi:hypothetical protein E2C01_040062 [Portunus trituberculatus]|uniref:Uncharacterized protein n=1 Tax=Portunus trituberculatus TaxID=210409 RepID=A0A5B7FPQ0_PORTR|nr:hypothetical protein [Portunus trituberculatus]
MWQQAAVSQWPPKAGVMMATAEACWSDVPGCPVGMCSTTVLAHLLSCLCLWGLCSNMPAITTSNAISYLNPDTPSLTPPALPQQPHSQRFHKYAKCPLRTSLPSNPTTAIPKSPTPSASSSPPSK